MAGGKPVFILLAFDLVNLIVISNGFTQEISEVNPNQMLDEMGAVASEKGTYYIIA